MIRGILAGIALFAITTDNDGIAVVACVAIMIGEFLTGDNS